MNKQLLQTFTFQTKHHYVFNLMIAKTKFTVSANVPIKLSLRNSLSLYLTPMSEVSSINIICKEIKRFIKTQVSHIIAKRDLWNNYNQLKQNKLLCINVNVICIYRRTLSSPSLHLIIFTLINY